MDHSNKIKQTARMDCKGTSAWQNTPCCQRCTTPFTLFLQPHHCRICNSCICDTCSRFEDTIRFCKPHCLLPQDWSCLISTLPEELLNLLPIIELSASCHKFRSLFTPRLIWFPVALFAGYWISGP